MWEKTQTRWDVELASAAKTSQTHMGMRRAKPIEAVTESKVSSKHIDHLFWHVHYPRRCIVETRAGTHAQERGEATAVVAHGEVVRFGPDDLHYVLIELGLFPLWGENQAFVWSSVVI